MLKAMPIAICYHQTQYASTVKTSRTGWMSVMFASSTVFLAAFLLMIASGKLTESGWLKRRPFKRLAHVADQVRDHLELLLCGPLWIRNLEGYATRLRFE